MMQLHFEGQLITHLNQIDFPNVSPCPTNSLGDKRKPDKYFPFSINSQQSPWVKDPILWSLDVTITNNAKKHIKGLKFVVWVQLLTFGSFEFNVPTFGRCYSPI